MASQTGNREQILITGIPTRTTYALTAPVAPTYGGQTAIIDTIDLRDGTRHLATEESQRYIQTKAHGKTPKKMLTLASTAGRHWRAVSAR